MSEVQAGAETPQQSEPTKKDSQEFSVSSNPPKPRIAQMKAWTWTKDKLPSQKPQWKGSYTPIVIGVALSAVIGFAAGWLGAHHGDGTSILTNTTSSQKQIVTSESQLISNIAKTVGPSVVSVNVTGTSQNTMNSFFGFGGAPQTQQSAGTGIILTSQGLIITNRHVVPAGTTNVSVTLSDGTALNDVTVLGRTSSSSSLDVAFLKINNANGHKLVPAQLGDSTKMEVGDDVVAIGNALGQFQNTVTSGIISGYGRTVQASSADASQASENLDDLFQTDAAINEGNSGGPLVNLNGQVIGINTAIAGNAQNIGFAIPINDIVGLISQVENTGKLQQPYLGVYYIPLTDDVAQQYSLHVSRGAWIPPVGVAGQDPILSGGPAASAGLQAGDIITQIDGTTIDQSNSLTAIIDKKQVGNTVDLTVVRDGKTVHVKATLAAAPTDS